MNIKITCNKHRGESESVMLSSYCSVLDGSLADLFTIPCFENVQTTKWAEHSGEVANFSIAKCQAISFSIKAFGKVADLNVLNTLLSDSLGTTNEQSIEAHFADINGANRTLYIPAEFVKMSSFSALSVDGNADGTMASATLEFRCSKNEFPDDSFDTFFGVLSNWTSNGNVRKTESLKKSIQGNRYSFYELDEDEVKELEKITDIDDFFWQSEMCLGSLGFTVLKGYLQSAYSPNEQNAPLSIRTIETDQTLRNNSDKMQSRDVVLKMSLRQPTVLAAIQAIGMLKRYFYTILKRTRNALVFLDEKEGIAFKCYPKSCKVDKWTNRGYAELSLTLRSTDEIRTRFNEPEPEEAPEPEEVKREPKMAILTMAFTKRYNDFDPFNIKKGEVKRMSNLTIGTDEYDQLRKIPKGAVLVSYKEADFWNEFTFSFPPLTYFGSVSIYGVTTAEITQADLQNGTWRNKVQTSGEVAVPYETKASVDWVTTSFVAEGIKVVNCDVVTQTDYNTNLTELQKEANGTSTDKLWQDYFSYGFWQLIKNKI